MLIVIDRGFAVLMLLGAVGHTIGSFAAYGRQPETLLWAICASLLAVLIGALNLIRSSRRHDLPVAWLAFAASASWLAVSAWFAILLGNLLDPRPLVFSVISLGLMGFSLRSALNTSRA